MTLLKLLSVIGRWTWEGFPWKSYKGEMCFAGDLGRGKTSQLPVSPCLSLAMLGREEQGLESGFLTAQGSVLDTWLLAVLG